MWASVMAPIPIVNASPLSTIPKLGLGGLDLELLYDGQSAFASQLRENGPNASAVHFFVDLVAEVLVGRIGEDLATATPQGAGSAAHTGATRAFLAPGLAGGFVDFGPVFLLAIATASIGLIGDNHLVNQGLVEIPVEDDVCGLNGSGCLTSVV